MSWLEDQLGKHPRILYVVEHVWDEGMFWMLGICLLALTVFLLD